MPSRLGDTLTANHIGFLVGAAILCVLSGIAWRGHWRNWAGGLHGPVAITIMPGSIGPAAVYGISPLLPFQLFAVMFLFAFVVFAVGFFLLQRDPSWFGPAWYRDFKRRGDRSTVSAGITVALTARPTAAQHSENLARHARRPHTPSIRHHASLIDPELGKPTGLHTAGLATGHLLYYDDELVFAAEAADDAARPGPTIRAIPADTITAVDVVPTARTKTVQIRFPSLQIVTTTGDQWTFECARARRAADDIRRLYLPGHGAIRP